MPLMELATVFDIFLFFATSLCSELLTKIGLVYPLFPSLFEMSVFSWICIVRSFREQKPYKTKACFTQFFSFLMVTRCISYITQKLETEARNEHTHTHKTESKALNGKATFGPKTGLKNWPNWCV